MLKRLAVLSALAISTIAVAHATPITGDLALYGTDSFTATSITFTSAIIAGGPGANTGSFSGLTYGNPVQMFPAFGGSALPYSTGYNVVPSNIAPVEVMNTTENGTTFSFWMTDYTAMYLVNATGCTSATCLSVTGDGYFSGTGYTDTPGSFTFTTQEKGTQTSTTFSASAGAAATPEPASLALVGSGLLGFVGFARRKFAAQS